MSEEFEGLFDMETVGDHFQNLSEQFDNLCQARHEEGAQKYGDFTWMENDVIRMMIEELADMCNYARYQAVKLLLLQEHLSGELQTESITIGWQNGKGTKNVGWNERSES